MEESKKYMNPNLLKNKYTQDIRSCNVGRARVYSNYIYVTGLFKTIA